MLHVELRLLHRIEARDEVVQARRPHDEDDLSVGRHGHGEAAPFASMISRSRSGDTLSWPIFAALSARSRKARASSCPGCIPTLASACRTLASLAAKDFIMASMP